MIAERIEVFDTAKGKITQEVYIKEAGAIALNKQGELYAISENKVVRVDFARAKHREIITDLKTPRALATDAEGNLYVFDATAKVIRVYDDSGRFLREIGKREPFKAGPWDPDKFRSVVDIDVDKQGHLWVVENNYHPKRISQWTIQGRHLKDFYGPTRYGGNGVLDPYDKRRLYVGPCEFELDWQTGKVRLKNYLWLGWTYNALIPIKVNKRTYMVTPSYFNAQACGIVYLREKDQLRMVAAMGCAGGFSYLKEPQIQDALGYPTLPDKKFIWYDRNGDGKLQAKEVKLMPRAGLHSLTNFNRDLGVQGGKFRYEVKRFLPNGVPVYEEKVFPLKGHGYLRMTDGSFFKMDEMNVNELAGYTSGGKKTWAYRTEGPGVQALTKCRPYFDGQVVSNFDIVGHATAHTGDLGEFVVINGNTGNWSVWTSDGLFAGDILRTFRRPGARAWHFPEHERGMDLTNLTAGQEHFHGYFCRTVDNKYYIVAGHNHASVVEVLGMDKFTRFTGEVKVSGADLRRVQTWEREQAKRKVYVQAPVIDCYKAKEAIRVDGNPADWERVQSMAKVNTQYDPQHATLKIAWSDKDLYLLYNTRGVGPMKNSGDQWDRLFKTGAAVDLQLGLDPQADPKRQAPVQGDLRILMTFNRGKYTAVLYNAEVPGTPDDRKWVVHSPVAQETFDVVKRLPRVKMAHSSSDYGYVFEAAIPLKLIGLEPKPGLRLKLDWGLLVADAGGNVVVRRIYWANKATSIVADAPSEARLHPDLWGTVRFHGESKSGLSVTSDLTLGDETEDGGEVEDFLEELEEDVKED